MSFTMALSRCEKKAQELYCKFDEKVKTFSNPYPTEKPDYRIKHPIHNYVFCELMIRSSSLWVRIRVDSAAISKPAHEMNIVDEVPPPTGSRWIKMELTSEDDLKYALEVVDSLRKG